jgi:hypothetical protein
MDKTARNARISQNIFATSILGIKKPHRQGRWGTISVMLNIFFLAHEKKFYRICCLRQAHIAGGQARRLTRLEPETQAEAWQN